MKIQPEINEQGFGMVLPRPEGATIVRHAGVAVTFYSGELDFLNDIQKLSNKSKEKIILAFAKLAAEANTP